MTFRITEIKHIHHQCIRIFCLIIITECIHLPLIQMQHFCFQPLSSVAIKFYYSPYRTASCAYLKCRSILVRYTENVFKISIHILVIIPDLHDHKFLLPFNLFPTGISKRDLRHQFIQARRKAAETNVSSLSRHDFTFQDGRIVLHQRILYRNRRQRPLASSGIRYSEGNTSGLIAQELAGTIVLTCQKERTDSGILQFKTYARSPQHILAMEERERLTCKICHFHLNLIWRICFIFIRGIRKLYLERPVRINRQDLLLDQFSSQSDIRHHSRRGQRMSRITIDFSFNLDDITRQKNFFRCLKCDIKSRQNKFIHSQFRKSYTFIPRVYRYGMAAITSDPVQHKFSCNRTEFICLQFLFSQHIE